MSQGHEAEQVPADRGDLSLDLRLIMRHLNVVQEVVRFAGLEPRRGH